MRHDTTASTSSPSSDEKGGRLTTHSLGSFRIRAEPAGREVWAGEGHSPKVVVNLCKKLVFSHLGAFPPPRCLSLILAVSSAGSLISNSHGRTVVRTLVRKQSRRRRQRRSLTHLPCTGEAMKLGEGDGWFNLLLQKWGEVEHREQRTTTQQGVLRTLTDRSDVRTRVCSYFSTN